MLNVSIAGVGGQGNVLAAKILAQAAQAHGWLVREAETIGMAQRGGSVVSHVRIGNNGEEFLSPLPAKGTVDVIIAMEPGEAARALPLLKDGGLVVTCTAGITPVALGVESSSYNTRAIIEKIEDTGIKVIKVDPSGLQNKKTLNVAMLATALGNYNFGITLDEMRNALKQCVKPQFVDMNMAVIDLIEESN